MTEESAELREIRSRRKAQRLFNGVMFIGLAVVVALIGFIVQGQQVNGQAINRLQETLKYTCGVAQDSSPARLPAAIEDNCEVAEQNKVVEYIQGAPEVDNPDPNDPERQEAERQESEIQDPEKQDPEIQETELQEPELADPEIDETEIQEPELQEDEIQEPEVQEPEEQNFPVCREGYTATDVQWYGPDGVANTDDDQIWNLCVKDGS